MKKKQNIADKDLFQPADKETQKKLDFFWEHCSPEIESGITDSIREQTLRKIQGKMNLQPLVPEKKKNIKTFYITVTSIAASIAILVAAIHFINHSPQQDNIRNVISQIELPSFEDTDEVVLVMSDMEKHQLATDAQITYTPEGNVSVNSEKLSLEKEHPQKGTTIQELYNQLIVPKGKRSQLLLSDGTKVWVNAGTKVIYPRIFNEKKREIYVEGEVYLEVTHDKNRPFYVNTDGFDVKVLGTSFDVFAYKQMPASQVVLVNGAVEIKDRNNQTIQMQPDELVSLEQNNITGKKQVNAKDYRAWIDGIMILNGDHLRQLAERLSLLYGTPIKCDSSLANEQVYGKLDLRDNLDEIIDNIKSMIPISAREENGIIHLKRE